MAKLHYSTLSFHDKGDHLQVNLLRLFYAEIPKEEVEKIARFIIPDPNTIEFVKIDQEKAETKFSFLLAKYFDQLKNRLTGNPVTYIHKNSGIPLIGNVAFGIVYRNSSIIEISRNFKSLEILSQFIPPYSRLLRFLPK